MKSLNGAVGSDRGNGNGGGGYKTVSFPIPFTERVFLIQAGSMEKGAHEGEFSGTKKDLSSIILSYYHTGDGKGKDKNYGGWIAKGI